MALPKRKVTSMSEFIEAFFKVKRAVIDGTERPILRAKDHEQSSKSETILAKKSVIHVVT